MYRAHIYGLVITSPASLVPLQAAAVCPGDRKSTEPGGVRAEMRGYRMSACTLVIWSEDTVSEARVTHAQCGYAGAGCGMEVTP